MTRIILLASAAILIASPALADGYEPCPSCKTPDVRPKVKVHKAPVRAKTRVVYVPRIIEKKVPVYVDHPVEVERRVEVPVDRPVYIEKRVEVPVDRPVYIDRPRIIERTVEVPVDRPVYIDRPVYVDRTRTVVVERPVFERVEHYYESGRIRPYPANDYPAITGHYQDISGHESRTFAGHGRSSSEDDCSCQDTENAQYSQYGNYEAGHLPDIRNSESGHYRTSTGHGGGYESGQIRPSRYGSYGSYESDSSSYESESYSSSSSYGSGYGYGQWSGYDGYGYNVGQYSGINGAGGRWRQQNYRRR
jgi:hypothetical protein